MNIMSRSRVEVSTLTMQVRQADAGDRPELPVFGVQTMNQFLAQQRSPIRVFGSMSSANIPHHRARPVQRQRVPAVTAYRVAQRHHGDRRAHGTRCAARTGVVAHSPTGPDSTGHEASAESAPVPCPLSSVLQSMVMQIPTKDTDDLRGDCSPSAPR